MSTEVLLEEELNVDLLEEIEETVGNEVNTFFQLKTNLRILFLSR